MPRFSITDSVRTVMTGGSFAWPPLGDDQRELLALVHTLASERIAPRAAEIDETHEFPWDIVELYREQGLFGLFFEERFGGTGTGPLLALAAIEEVSKVCATSGVILAVQELGSLALKLAGSEEQQARYLPRLASGEWLAAYALTESGSGSDSAAMRTSARRDGDDYVLNGDKRFITNAGVASLYTVFARTDPTSKHRGISAFVVESDSPGFEVARLEPKLGIAGLDDRRARLRRLPRARGEPDRDRGRRLRARDARARPLPRRHRRPGGRDRGGGNRVRAQLCEGARDDGLADRPAPADRGQAGRHGHRLSGGARAALPPRPDARGRRRRRRS